MEYVKSFNLFGVEGKEIPCIIGKGKPTAATEGAVGCLYMNERNGDLYKCTAVDGGVHTWESITKTLEARVDELTAMRGDGGGMTFDHDATDVEFHIRSNGTYASIAGRLSDAQIDPGYTGAIKVDVPDAFRPFLGEIPIYSDDEKRISLVVKDGEPYNTYFEVYNKTDSLLYIPELYFDEVYALHNVFIPELSDMRVDDFGETHETAGSSVRHQFGILAEKIDEANAYADSKDNEVIDKLCPSFTESGIMVRCEPVEGYPLTVTAEEGATTITQRGKNLINYEDVIPRKNNKISFIKNGILWESGSYYFSFSCTIKAGDMVVFNCEDPSSSMLNAVLWDTVLNKECGKQSKIGEPFTATADANMIHVYKKDSKTEIETPIELTNLQLEYGSAATEYEPYQQPETFGVGEAVPALSGTNVLYADSGEITVTGKSDPVAIINKLTNAIISLGSNL
jgi:hypothetical protein